MSNIITELNILEDEQNTTLRMMTYTEWLAEELDLDTVTGLDADYDSLEIYNTLVRECPFTLLVAA